MTRIVKSTSQINTLKHPASLLDLISYLMDDPDRRLDGAVITHLPSGWANESALQKGATSAHFEFLYTASILMGREWVFDHDFNATIETVAFQRPEDASSFIEDCLLQPKDLRKHPTFRQYLVQTPDKDLLVTIADHAVTDLTSLFQWIRHQLKVVRGQEANKIPKSFDPPVLRFHNNPKRKNSSAHLGPSATLWKNTSRCSARRAFHSTVIEIDKFENFLAQNDGCTYNDLLTATALKAAQKWNQDHSQKARRISVWLPVNIREKPFNGFGNGSSRIRIYADPASSKDLVAFSKNVRHQVRNAKKEGEWFVPQRMKLEALPDSLLYPLLRLYFDRPWVDMGTLPFSHVEKITPPESTEGFDQVLGFEVIGSLHRRHPLGITAITHKKKTTFTCTYDPAQLTQDDVEEFLALIRTTLKEAED